MMDAKEKNWLFSIFPNEGFVDLGLYQYGWEQCEPLHSYGPHARNHYLFHYVISGTGRLQSTDSQGVTTAGIFNLSQTGQHLFCGPGPPMGVCVAGI